MLMPCLECLTVEPDIGGLNCDTVIVCIDLPLPLPVGVTEQTLTSVVNNIVDNFPLDDIRTYDFNTLYALLPSVVLSAVPLSDIPNIETTIQNSFVELYPNTAQDVPIGLDGDAFVALVVSSLYKLFN